RPEPEVAFVHPERVAFPVERAAADTAGPASLELIDHRASHGVPIELPRQGRPGILVAKIAAHGLAAAGEVMARAGFEHDHLNAPPGQLQGEHAASCAGTDDANLGLHRRPPGLPPARARAACIE